jgi:enoyl-[acyl-carrier-protein] reductase (NADH)
MPLIGNETRARWLNHTLHFPKKLRSHALIRSDAIIQKHNKSYIDCLARCNVKNTRMFNAMREKLKESFDQIDTMVDELEQLKSETFKLRQAQAAGDAMVWH